MTEPDGVQVYSQLNIHLEDFGRDDRGSTISSAHCSSNLSPLPQRNNATMSTSPSNDRLHRVTHIDHHHVDANLDAQLDRRGRRSRSSTRNDKPNLYQTINSDGFHVDGIQRRIETVQELHLSGHEDLHIQLQGKTVFWANAG